MRFLFKWFTRKRKRVHLELDVGSVLEAFDASAGHQILDVRTEKEMDRDRISDNQIEIDLFQPEFMEMVNQLDRSKVYFIYCRSGSRSATACKAMIDLGFDKVNNIAGGIVKWRSVHGPRKL